MPICLYLYLKNNDYSSFKETNSVLQSSSACPKHALRRVCLGAAQSLCRSYTEPTQKMLNIDNYLNNNEVYASSRVRVREEKNREEKNHHQKKMKNNHFEELLRGLNSHSSWGELACMKSGYSDLLMKYFDEAVKLFGQHVVLYGNQHQIHDVSDVQKYFVNFVASGSRTSKELHDKLQALERKRQQNNDNLYRYEQCIDGRRCYMGCPLPDDAPPRPSPKAIWNEREAYWYEPTA